MPSDYISPKVASAQCGGALPRLLYLGNVPVEHTVAGSTLLFRNLQTYPTGKLLVCEMGEASRPDRRLPGVAYVNIPLGAQRLAHTRLVALSSLWRQASARILVQKAIQAAAGFKPEAVLTVAHGWSWYTASLVAQALGMPLHLIVHDHPPEVCDLPKGLQFWTERRFRRVYRTAMSRLCISPWMERFYREQYGVSGTWLYPSRAADAPIYDQLPEPRIGETFTLGFAGTITDGYAQALRKAAAALDLIGGKILIYSPQNEKSISRLALRLPNIQIEPVVPYRHLLEEFRQKTDVLFLPLSFRSEERVRMITSFQSKLADYSLTGLPILIYGPAYASAVQWARENPLSVELVDCENGEALTEAVVRLCQDSSLRARLGENSLQRGQEYFSHAATTRNFLSSLQAEPGSN